MVRKGDRISLMENIMKLADGKVNMTFLNGQPLQFLEDVKLSQKPQE